ncbi:MAG: hypothetical protein HQK66_08725 [Desulfamplus sp.]|nr:hypothetical protein [Desulfamplus sp.]
MPTLGSVAKIIHTDEELPRAEKEIPASKTTMARADALHLKGVAKSDLQTPEADDHILNDLFEDQFLSLKDIITPKSDLIKKTEKKSVDDILEMFRDNQWDNIIALYHPVDEDGPRLICSAPSTGSRMRKTYSRHPWKRICVQNIKA